MKNPFRKKVEVQNIEVFTGRVRFIDNGSVNVGTVFGTPFRDAISLIGNPLKYHIVRADNKVIDVESHKIEKWYPPETEDER